MAVGQVEGWIMLRIGPWSFWRKINSEGRFPDVESHVAQPDQAVATCSIPEDDRKFLLSNLPRLPCDDDYNSPVAVDLNGTVAVRSKGTDQSVMELVVPGATRAVEPIRLNTNRQYLQRAMQLGFGRLHIFGNKAVEPGRCTQATLISPIPTFQRRPQMPRHSATETAHWKDRTARQINKRIEAITAADPNFFEQIRREAHQRVLQSLGLTKYQTQLDEIERNVQTLRGREKQILKAMLASIGGVGPEDLDDRCSCRRNSEADNAVARQDGPLAESELGLQIVNLRREKDELLDVVWLATSGAEIRRSWAKVVELLGDEPTQIQNDALAVSTATDD